jgi:hypothetical protein
MARSSSLWTHLPIRNKLKYIEIADWFVAALLTRLPLDRWNA